MPFAISAAYLVVTIATTWLLRLILVRANVKIRQAESEAEVLYAL